MRQFTIHKRSEIIDRKKRENVSYQEDAPVQVEVPKNMEEALEQTEMQQEGMSKGLEPGSVIDAKVIHKAPNLLLVEINGSIPGVIAGREVQDSDDTYSQVSVGDTVKAAVLSGENEEGHYPLSLRVAAQARRWDRFDEACENAEIITVRATEANKGGLLLDIDGIKGFIPVSQLSPKHYPRVNNANTEEILRRLQKLVGIDFHVRVLTIDRTQGKLILSERKAEEETRDKAMNTLKVGDTVDGVVSGIVNFGIFVTFQWLEGLVHISEIAWSKVTDPHNFAKENDKVQVLIIGLEEGKISLSIKRLQPDPWIEAAKELEIGKTVKGPVTRMENFGAFLKVNDHIDGLIHLSEIDHRPVKNPAEFLSIGQEVETQVITLDLENHRLGLSIKALQPAPEGQSDEEKKKLASKKKPASKKQKSQKEETKENPESEVSKEEVKAEKEAEKENKESEK